MSAGNNEANEQIMQGDLDDLVGQLMAAERERQLEAEARVPG